MAFGLPCRYRLRPEVREHTVPDPAGHMEVQMIGQKKFPASWRQARLLLGGLVLTVLSLPIRADVVTTSTGADPIPTFPDISVLSQLHIRFFRAFRDNQH